MSTKDGGPAFPGDRLRTEAGYVTKERYPVQGMSLRDYFAAKAMQGLIAQSMGSALGSDPTQAAWYAYAVADAMLAARAKEAGDD